MFDIYEIDPRLVILVPFTLTSKTSKTELAQKCNKWKSIAGGRGISRIIIKSGRQLKTNNNKEKKWNDLDHAVTHLYMAQQYEFPVRRFYPGISLADYWGS
jgi:hypothetical protein